ncbi:MAG: 50S ribosomal protein L23 [Gammaproteobacteria bacterium]|nr:50S ribosomal protein L23 [Gammaproteobacteria bacterium]
MSHSQLSDLLEAPIISEKSTTAAEKSNRFVFRIKKQATKLQIKKAVETMFDVEVESVQVLNVKGKKKRFGKTMGQRSNWKKAYVKLKQGHDISFVTP